MYGRDNMFAAIPPIWSSPSTLGAAEVVLGGDKPALSALKAGLDLILSTVLQAHDLNAFMPLLKRDRKIVVVGALEPLKPINNMKVAGHPRGIAGSLIGNIAETQKILVSAPNTASPPTSGSSISRTSTTLTSKCETETFGSAT